jgi:hypothetical protein
MKKEYTQFIFENLQVRKILSKKHLTFTLDSIPSHEKLNFFEFYPLFMANLTDACLTDLALQKWIKHISENSKAGNFMYVYIVLSINLGQNSSVGEQFHSTYLLSDENTTASDFFDSFFNNISHELKTKYFHESNIKLTKLTLGLSFTSNTSLAKNNVLGELSEWTIT